MSIEIKKPADWSPGSGPTTSPIVIDLGKKSRKRVRQLRKGKPGKLTDQVKGAIAHLQSEGVVGAGAQPVIIIVRNRRKRRKLGMFGMR